MVVQKKKKEQGVPKDPTSLYKCREESYGGDVLLVVQKQQHDLDCSRMRQTQLGGNDWHKKEVPLWQPAFGAVSTTHSKVLGVHMGAQQWYYKTQAVSKTHSGPPK